MVTQPKAATATRTPSTTSLFQIYIVVNNDCISHKMGNPSSCCSYQVFPLIVLMYLVISIPSLFYTSIIVISDCLSHEVVSPSSCYSYQVLPLIVIMCEVISIPSLFHNSTVVISDCISHEVVSPSSCYSYKVYPLIVVVFVDVIPSHQGLLQSYDPHLHPRHRQQLLLQCGKPQQLLQ